MKRGSIIFLQTVIVLIGIVVLAIMIRFPLTEGAAVNRDLLSIYFNPSIIYGYIASIPFFVALYQAFKFLAYIGRDEAFSLNAVKALRNIRYCAIIAGILIAMAILYIKLFHDKNDDPAGFIALATVTTFISIVTATVVEVLERLLRSVVEMKSQKAQ